jgi:hypothetical protein
VRGALRFERKQYPEAQRDLEESRRLLPTPLASLYLGEIAEANGATRQAEIYYREAAADNGAVGQRARGHLGAVR